KTERPNRLISIPEKPPNNPKIPRITQNSGNCQLLYALVDSMKSIAKVQNTAVDIPSIVELMISDTAPFTPLIEKFPFLKVTCVGLSVRKSTFAFHKTAINPIKA